MTFRHSAFLSIIAGVLVGYVWLFENPFQDDSRNTQSDRRLFPGVTPISTTAIEIGHANQKTRLVKGSDGWHLDHPLVYPADGTKIDAFLTSVSQLQYLSVIPSADAKGQDDEDVYGLKSATDYLQIEIDESTFKLELGSASPGNLIFAKKSNSDQIYTLTSDLRKAINTDVDKWRDPRVFPHSASDINEIHIKGPANEILLSRTESTPSWSMKQPHPGARLDDSMVTWFLQAIAELRVGEFTTKQEIPTQVSIKLGLREGLSYSLHIKSPQAKNPALVWAYLPDSETTIALPTDFAQQIVNPVKAFRNPYVLDPGFAFDSIELTGEEKFTLAKDLSSGDWAITKPTPFPADQRLVAQFLYQLAELRINDFVTDDMTDESRYGVDFPFKSLTFSRNPQSDNESTPPPLRVRFGFEIKNHLMTHRSDEQSIYAVPFGNVIQLPKWAYQLRDRTLWGINSETISTIRVTYPEQTEYECNRVEGIWQKQNIALGEVESAAFQEMVEQLANVKTEAWTDRGTQIGPRYGIGNKATITIETSSSSEKEAPQISFGSISPRGHRYAMTSLDGIPTVFEFPGALYVKLNQLLTLETASDEE